MASKTSAHPVDVAVLLDGPSVGPPVAERLKSANKIESRLARCALGRLEDKRVVCAWPAGTEFDSGKLIAGLIAAHRPRLLIAAGLATPTTEQCGLHWVNRVSGPVGEPMRLTTPRAVESRLPAISVANAGSADDFGAHAAWAYEVAAACVEQNLSLVMLAVLEHDPAESSDPELRGYYHQQSVAGRLGAVVGSLWRRPGFAKEALAQMQSRYQARQDLADAIEGIVKSFATESGLYSPDLKD